MKAPKFSNTRCIILMITWLVLLCNNSLVNACSCVADTSFEQLVDAATDVDALYIFDGQIKVANGAFAGFVDPNAPVTDINADVFYLAYNWKSWKGCGVSGEYVILSTGGNSAQCGVRPQAGWTVVGSTADFNNPAFKRIGSCGIVKPWSTFTYPEYNFLESLPPTNCNSGSCTSDAQCGTESYCADGTCLPWGACGDLKDCSNPSNSYPVILCIGPLTCDAGSCGRECAASNCPAGESEVNCLVAPCSVLDCNEPYVSCVDDYCGACNTLVFNAAGEQVCT